ncbi:MAG: DEAD/DEAH box helicase [Zavarzinella sp.]
MNLILPLQQALASAGYVKPSPIQARLIPVALKGVDVVGQAQTGTGKTAAFLLPFMNQWRGGKLSMPQALVIAPTRELAKQVAEEAEKLSPSRFFKTVVVYGGANIRRQIQQIESGCTLLVGTPGRIIDLLQQRALSLDHLRYVVMDEADRMLDIGFRPQIERIMRKAPAERQTLLMSATWAPPIIKMTQKYMRDPVHINITPETMTVEKIDQKYITVDAGKKVDLLLWLIQKEMPKQSIIFVERKKTADVLFRKVQSSIPSSAAIHGDLDQRDREKIMARFREGSISMLIATDVMSRGIDVSGITHIINYDLPTDFDNYVHRIGRTGRMGADGIAISFVTPEQGSILTGIEQTINRLIPAFNVEGFVPFEKKEKVKEEAPPSQPVYGRSGRKYSNRL